MVPCVLARMVIFRVPSVAISMVMPLPMVRISAPVSALTTMKLTTPEELGTTVGATGGATVGTTTGPPTTIGVGTAGSEGCTITTGSDVGTAGSPMIITDGWVGLTGGTPCPSPMMI